ncbi:MAG: hypothetical protein II719_03600 [Clostridia bacterium]|nr:hypothetical protein [Clostridia bacterium]
MITATEYKKRPAVAIESGEMRAVFLPEDGAKLASLCFHGRETLEQAKGDAYLRLFPDSDYVRCECSAFDDMFPTIDPCELDGRRYPDHGEVCRIPHSFRREGEDLFFSCDARSVGARFSKRVRAEGAVLRIDYRIENGNETPLPCLWAAHMMFRGVPGARVWSCFPPDTVRRIRFGCPPDEPEVLGPFSPDGESYKYFLETCTSPLSCGIRYPDGRVLTVAFEGSAVRWLGVWINQGSFKGMYNIALEPCTAPYDSPENAEREDAGFRVPGGGETAFTLRIRMDGED